MCKPPPLFPDQMPGWAQTLILCVIFGIFFTALAFGAVGLLAVMTR